MSAGLAAWEEYELSLEDAARAQILERGWEITSERDGWVTVKKGDSRVAQPSFRDLLSWIEKRGARL